MVQPCLQQTVSFQRLVVGFPRVPTGTAFASVCVLVFVSIVATKPTLVSKYRIDEPFELNLIEKRSEIEASLLKVKALGQGLDSSSAAALCL